MTYRAPIRDLAFTLQAVAGIDQVAATGAFPDYDADVLGAVPGPAHRLPCQVQPPPPPPRPQRVGDLLPMKHRQKLLRRRGRHPNGRAHGAHSLTAGTDSASGRWPGSARTSCSATNRPTAR